MILTIFGVAYEFFDHSLYCLHTKSLLMTICSLRSVYSLLVHRHKQTNNFDQQKNNSSKEITMTENLNAHFKVIEHSWKTFQR